MHGWLAPIHTACYRPIRNQYHQNSSPLQLYLLSLTGISRILCFFTRNTKNTFSIPANVNTLSSELLQTKRNQKKKIPYGIRYKESNTSPFYSAQSLDSTLRTRSIDRSQFIHYLDHSSIVISTAPSPVSSTTPSSLPRPLLHRYLDHNTCIYIYPHTHTHTISPWSNATSSSPSSSSFSSSSSPPSATSSTGSRTGFRSLGGEGLWRWRMRTRDDGGGGEERKRVRGVVRLVTFIALLKGPGGGGG